MARQKNFSLVASELKSLQQSLGSVIGQTKKISKSLASGLERQLISRIGVFENDIQARIHESMAALSPMVELLSQLGGVSVGGGKGAAGRGSRGAGAARPGPKPGRRKKGRRGVRVTLSKEELENALAQVGGVKTRAADVLGVSVPTLNKKLAEAGVGSGPSRGRGRRKKK